MAAALIIEEHANQVHGDVPRLILITEGRYSGRSEAALLEYRRVNNEYLVVARTADHKCKPDWYLNLKEEPIVRVEIGDTAFHAFASTPTGSQRVRLLPVVGDIVRDGNEQLVPRGTAAILLTPMC